MTQVYFAHGSSRLTGKGSSPVAAPADKRPATDNNALADASRPVNMQEARGKSKPGESLSFEDAMNSAQQPAGNEIGTPPVEAVYAEPDLELLAGMSVLVPMPANADKTNVRSAGSGGFEHVSGNLLAEDATSLSFPSADKAAGIALVDVRTELSSRGLKASGSSAAEGATQDLASRTVSEKEKLEHSALARVSRESGKDPVSQPRESIAAPAMQVPQAGSSSQAGALKLPEAAPAQWRQPLMDALGERIQMHNGKHFDHAVIRLDPPMLGRVDISIRHEGGALQVHMSASHTDVIRQLQHITETLRQDLMQRQYANVSVSVSHDEQGGQGGQRQQRQETHTDRSPGRAWEEQGATASAFNFIGDSNL